MQKLTNNYQQLFLIIFIASSHVQNDQVNNHKDLNIKLFYYMVENYFSQHF